MEVWKEINDYPLYQVSNLGSVKSLRFGKDKILKSGLSKTGYLCVKLTNESNVKSQYIHRLVADHFIEKNNLGLVVDHINENKIDNRSENLQWVSQRTNILNISKEFTSDYKGVSYNKKLNIFRAQISLKDKKIWLGNSKDQKSLSKIYNKAVELLDEYRGNDKEFRELVKSLI